MAIKYIDIVLESEDSKDSLARLIHAIHKYNSPRATAGENGIMTHPLALSLPRFRQAEFAEGGRCISLPAAGETLRIFGEEADLIEYAKAPGVARMGAMGMAMISVPLNIPSGAASECFSRDRKLQKTYRNNAYARRQQKRAETQGRDYVAKKHGEVHPVARFEISSGSERQGFLLDVRREEAAPGAAWFKTTNSYGLCAHASSIPKF